MTGEAPAVLFTIQQLAGFLKVSRQAVQKRADRESWPFKEVPHAGRAQRLYHFSDLPLDVRRAIAIAEQAAAKVPVPVTSAEQQLRELQQLSGWKKDKANLTMEVWKAIEGHRETVGCNWPIALDDYNDNRIVVSDAARAAYPTVCMKRLERWRAKVNTKGLAGLAPNYGNRAGTGTLDTAMRVDPSTGEALKLTEWMLAVMFKEPQIKAQHLFERLQVEWPEVNATVNQVAAWVKNWKANNKRQWTLVNNPDAHKNSYAAAFGSHFENIHRLNQVWEMDSSPADWMLTDGRHTVIACVDLKSRRRRFLVSKTSNGEAIGALFRRCVLEWGVPELLRTDRGLDYTGSYLALVIDTLKIEPDKCDAFASEQKGTVERGFRTVFHSILETLDGFIGHNVAQRKAIEARKGFQARREGEEPIVANMDSVTLQTKLDEWTDLIYSRRPQKDLGNRSPFEVATASIDAIREIEDVRALDMLLMPVAGKRRVGKKGIRWDARPTYVATELVGQIGEWVLCRHDPADQGHLYVYTLRNEFICIAECPELLGVSRREIAVASNRAYRHELAKAKAQLREARKLIKRNTADVVMEARRAEAGVVTPFPKRTSTHTTPALQEAAKAVKARDGKVEVPALTGRALEIHEQMQAGTFQKPQAQPAAPAAAGPRLAQLQPSAAPTPEEDRARWFARLERVEAALAAGEEVSEIDRKWADKFKTLPVYLAHQAVQASGGR